MKLHCPHCGVKGSAEDSYLGRKVKCPKCQGIFEVLSEVDAEPPAVAPFSASPSPLSADVQSAAPEVDIPVAVDDDLAETEVDVLLVEDEAEVPYEGSEDVAAPEPVTTSAAELEEALEWEDTAAEVDLQLAEATVEEEDRVQQDGPAALSSFEEEFEKPVDDFDLMEELPPHDDAESPAEVRDNEQEQVLSETLNSERPGAGGNELPNDPADRNDNEKPMGNSISQAWAKARGALAKWFGK